MKIRLSFVSNSSSSSFICDYCGGVESGYDISLSEMGWIRCVNGHEVCSNDVTKEFDLETKEGFKSLKYLSDNDYHYFKYVQEDVDKIKQAINKCIELEDYTVSKLCELAECDEDSFWNCWEDMKYDFGYYPEEWCPVCQREKQMKQDTNYEKYKELYEHFKGVNPNGTV